MKGPIKDAGSGQLRVALSHINEINNRIEKLEGRLDLDNYDHEDHNLLQRSLMKIHGILILY